MRIVADLDFNSNTTGINTNNPSNNQDIATKVYVDTKGAKIDTFSASGVWTKPSGAKRIMMLITNGGKGGSSLKTINNAAPTANTLGPSGGTGGASAYFELDAAFVPDTVNVTVGAGGAGAAIRTSPGTNVGTLGGNSSFGSITTESTLIGATKTTTNAGTGGQGGGTVYTTSNAGETGYNSPDYAPYGSPLISATITSGGAGGTGTNGTVGSSSASITMNVGSGGGGGGGVYYNGNTLSLSSGIGGNGQIPGGGGGGGGLMFTRTGNNSSLQIGNKGGDGARGEVVVITFF